jgi:hypothetical protein
MQFPLKFHEVHHRDWKINLKVHLEVQKTANRQGNTEQKEKCLRYLNTQFQILLQSHSSKNSMVLTQKQEWRPVEKNRRHRYESMQLCPPHFWQSCQKHTMMKRQPLQHMLLWKLDIYMQETETRSVSIQVSTWSGQKTLI